MNPVAVFARDRILAVWAVLIVATLASWQYGTSHHAAVIVLIIATVKVRLIGTWFMELHDAHRTLRTIFDAWCLLLAACLVGPILLATWA